MAVTGNAPSLLDAGREEGLLLWLCSVGLAHNAGAAIPDIDQLDWPRFLELVRDHRVVPVVWRNALKRQDLILPPQVLAELRAAYQQNALHALRVSAHLAKMVAALGAAGIPSLPLKGIGVAIRYYGDTSARYAGDIDLMVSPEDVERADLVLRGLGHLRVSNATRTIVVEPFTEDTDFRLHYIYITRDGVPIELHFQLHNNPDVLPIDVPAIARGEVSVAVGKASLPVMPDDLQFVFLATHGARHEWVRLQWLCDIAVMMDRAEPDDVRQWLKTANRASLANPVVQGMVLAERLLGSSLPHEAARAFAQSRRIRFMVRRAERTMVRGEEGRIEGPGTPFDFGRRLYRMCVTGRPAYLWHELRSGMRAISERLLKPAASGP